MVTIPSNLDAADKMGVPREISEIVIPVGATLHMEGSCLAAVLKIAFLFGVFHMDFSGAGTILTAIGIGMLTGMVVSGIPGGGTIGELLIISLYGFPPEAFPLITIIGTLVDAPATMVNAVGDNVASLSGCKNSGRKRLDEGGLIAKFLSSCKKQIVILIEYARFQLVILHSSFRKEKTFDAVTNLFIHVLESDHFH